MVTFAPLGKARIALQRWLAGEEGVAAPPASAPGDEPLPPQASRDERLAAFMAALRSGKQDWFGRVRLINFDDIRKKVGPTWPKLREKVELLAEKVIRDKLSEGDLHVDLGDAEFAVFIADVSPEEVRVRCLAIVEVIHEKLFGIGGMRDDGISRFAECHIADLNNVESQATGAPAAAKPPTIDGLRRLFRPDAESLDGAGLAASAEAAIDAIIARAAQSGTLLDLAPLASRLGLLAADLEVLQSSLRGPAPDLAAGESDEAEDAPAGDPLKLVWEDIGTLAGIFDVGLEGSHADLLAALNALRRARMTAPAPAGAGAAKSGGTPVPAATVEYVPVCRFVSLGQEVYQGIYRLGLRHDPAFAPPEPDSPPTESQHQAAAAAERLLLEHALRFWANDGAPRFMLMVPVDIETLRRPHSHKKFSTLLRAAKLQAKRRLAIEIVGYRESDNTIGVRRAIEELRANCHAVFVSLSEDFSKLQQVAGECKRLEVHAFGIDATTFAGSRTELLSALHVLSAAGARHGVPTYVRGVGAVAVLAKAVAAGVNYICAPALITPLAEPKDFQRITLDELYSAI